MLPPALAAGLLGAPLLGAPLLGAPLPGAPLPGAGAHPWPAGQDPAQVLEARIPPPRGFRRVEVPAGSFAAWLRRLPLKPGRPAVHLFDGRPKANQEAHAAVLDLDVGGRDLQQCADAVIRLRAEWLWAAGRWREIRFTFTSGASAEYARWREGFRPSIGAKGRVTWGRSAPEDASYGGFRAYLDTVFQYAGTASLARDLGRVPEAERVEAGDVFVKGGYPGHAALVLDVAQDEAGRRVFLLAQSFMPAQEVHLLRNPGDPGLGPWYPARFGERLVTPEWTFGKGERRRFPLP